ncbi:hypothetical protein LAZ67_7001479 [Cordylochernes scorpioides]|uniref:Integrase catalytic domain-containing protein n=1 Tax=Cordylochernes scorpioides TaxID=51811 RepID=A0ABY6KMC1_9ARAC|nr:hypothetical protein LAZ67_7001479 [Cordylochernes scorpioides]
MLSDAHLLLNGPLRQISNINLWLPLDYCMHGLTAITKRLPTSESVEVVKYLNKYVILKHGAPRELIADRGRNYTSSIT